MFCIFFHLCYILPACNSFQQVCDIWLASYQTTGHVSNSALNYFLIGTDHETILLIAHSYVHLLFQM